MNVTRAMIPVFLVVVGACAPRSTVETPKPLMPQDGPKGWVRVSYDGGLFHRRAMASFRVDQPAHVMVAHLGGDGVIRVLFPEDGRYSTLVSRARSYRTATFIADYDAAPGYWLMRPAMFRSAGARHYSYDGRGHGYVFMIASHRSFKLDHISEFGLWDELEVSDYQYSTDPRQAIRKFADVVAGGGGYTLEYARSFSSHSYYGYADASMDCAILSSGLYHNWLGLADFGSYAWSYGFSPWSYASRGWGGCGYGRYASRRYASLYGPWNFGPPQSGWTRPVTTASKPTQILPEVKIPAHRIPRPGRREEASNGSTLAQARPTYSRPARPNWDDDDRRGRASPVDVRRSSPPESSRPASTPAREAPSTSARPAGSTTTASPPARPASDRRTEVKRDP